MSEIIVCAGTSSRSTNKVKPEHEVAQLWMGEKEELPLFSHLILNYKLDMEPASPTNTDLGKTQRITV